MSERHVMIIGGNFAGLAAARALGSTCQVTVIDPSSHFEWTPHIHDLVADLKSVDSLTLQRQKLFDAHGVRFIQSTAERIDPIEQTISLADGTEHEYDACLLACGGQQNRSLVNGAEEFAAGFRSAADASHITERLEHLSARRKLIDVCIVGAGLSGVELLGALLRNRRYRGRLRVHIIDPSDRLLESQPAELDADIRKKLDATRSILHLGKGATVRAIFDDRLELEDGTLLRSDLTIWAAGIAATPLVTRLCKDSHFGFQPGSDGIGVIVDDQLNPVLSDAAKTADPAWRRSLFIAGDCASLEGRPLAKQGYHALEMGELAAQNIIGHFNSTKLQSFSAGNKPLLIALGNLEHYLSWNGLVAAGSAFETMKESVFQYYMAKYSLALGPVTASVGSLGRGAQAVQKQLLPGMMPSGPFETLESLFPNPLFAIPRAALRRLLTGQRILRYANPFSTKRQ